MIYVLEIGNTGRILSTTEDEPLKYPTETDIGQYLKSWSRLQNAVLKFTNQTT